MNILQLQASNPKISSWVSASAGTGKTKILTDRVLRLVLQDVPFNKILCLTFTNAAASEMKERIISQAKKWSKCNTSDLSLALKQTLGRSPTQQELKKASSLFDDYIKTQNQINIHTIHSFCQKLLKRFPLEAGISPNFKIIDEIKIGQIIKIIKKQLFNMPDLAPIIKFFAENFHELVIDDIFNEIIAAKNKIKRYYGVQPHGVSWTLNPYYQCHSYAPVYHSLESTNDRKECIINGTSLQQALQAKPELWKHVENLLVSSKNPEDSYDDEAIKSLFLTSSGAKKKRIVPKKIASPESALYKELEKVQDEVYNLDQKLKTERLILYSELLTILACKLVSSFEEYKKQKALLDYDDLIIYAENLLTHAPSKEWVLYKLDGGIDHLLVDEAQDTSESQWRIIESLVEEFYAGQSGNKDNRTIFVVGDEKQSIFSFQGADISAFFYMNKFLGEKLQKGKKPFANIDLNISYRSAPEILEVVDKVFNKIAKNNSDDFDLKLPEMSAHRSNTSGLVELWPLTVCSDQEDGNRPLRIWPVLAQDNTSNSKVILAEKIANYVSIQIESGKVLPSTCQPIKASDFMILVRSRDDFTSEVIKALVQKGIATTGLDRVLLSEDLGVKDLMSIVKFILNPDDDLNLSSLLKSSIFGVIDEFLQEIIIASGKYKFSIWQYLCAVADQKSFKPILDTLRQFNWLYQNCPATDFFLYITEVFGYRNILAGDNEAIDEFLILCQSYFLEHGSGWQNFVYWFEENDIFVKKSNNQEEGKLKIMTVHGAKGLQAPIVILCDTTKLPSSDERFIWDNNYRLLSAKSSDDAPEFYLELKKTRQKLAYQEYLRLLYVGMTRAEDHLVICGYQGSNKIPENCWYELTRSGMQDVKQESYDGVLVYGSANHINKGPARNHCKRSVTKHDNPQNHNPREIYDFEEMDRFALFHSHRNDDASSIAIQELQTRAGMLRRNNNDMEYGTIFHKILEDAVSSNDLPRAYNHPLAQSLTTDSQERLYNNLTKVITNQEFTELLLYPLKTELSFGYRVGDDNIPLRKLATGGQVQIGRVDLAVFKEDQVIIIDYKSDRTVHINIDDIPVIPENYREQLSFYQEALAKIYPDKTVICKILWLEKGFLQDVY